MERSVPVRIAETEARMSAGFLHMVCGKIGSGKSTHAALLAAEHEGVLLCEDDWLAMLFGPEMTSIRDYVRYSERLKHALAPHLVDLLGRGMTVVLDFPANTPKMRSWFGDLIVATGCDHRLHYLDVPDTVCLTRLMDRNASGGHPFKVTEDQFREMTRHFVPPALEEGFEIAIHGSGG